MLTFLILFLLTGALFFFLGVAYEQNKSISHHYATEQCPECNGLGKYRSYRAAKHSFWTCQLCKGQGFVNRYVDETPPK